MRNAGWHVVMLLDNFSGHYIEYEPRNICLEYFEPNLTSFIQPCNAGIIRCVKAHYRRAYCIRAIELDKLDIYKINLLEAMLMMKDAWDAVSPETIKHCWNHTQILPKAKSATPAETILEKATPMTVKGWEVIHEFAMSSSMTLPQAEEKLKAIFGAGYVDDTWRPALNAVLEAENDEQKALEAIEKLTHRTDATITTTNHTEPVTPPSPSAPPQLQEVEKELIDTVNELKACRRIVGAPLTLEEMLDPVEEREIGDSAYRFKGGDDEIVATVQKEFETTAGDVMEVDESDDEEEGEEELTTKQVMEMCQQMEGLCIKHGSFKGSLDLAKHIRRYRIHLTKEQSQRAKQTTLDGFF